MALTSNDELVIIILHKGGIFFFFCELDENVGNFIAWFRSRNSHNLYPQLNTN